MNRLQLLRLVLDEARATLLTSISLLVTLQLLGICCAERELTGLIGPFDSIHSNIQIMVVQRIIDLRRERWTKLRI